MLCEQCKKNFATLHFQQIVNGNITESHLCDECASKMNMFLSFDDMFKGFLDGFISTDSSQQYKDENYNKVFDIKCPECGYTFNDFKKSSKFGCSSCYETFKSQLDTVLKNIQGSNVHTGKFPKKSGSQLIKKREIENLRVSLKKAVETEEYEQAAKLRDEIKALEKEEK